MHRHGRWVLARRLALDRGAARLPLLGRYTHRVGLSNHRLRWMDERGVCFRIRGDKAVTLSAEEFLRRFLMRVLPHRFVKIRHFPRTRHEHRWPGQKRQHHLRCAAVRRRSAFCPVHVGGLRAAGPPSALRSASARLRPTSRRRDAPRVRASPRPPSAVFSGRISIGLAIASPGREPARSNPTFTGLRRDLAAAAAQVQSRKRLFVGPGLGPFPPTGCDRGSRPPEIPKNAAVRDGC
ncbi:transposase [Sorangium sp. So ce448]|uniref:transposase n=1 Tax=Sorangium sp. So ce448 TaxID=3133314 RepID=UPI003F5EEDC8